MRKLLHCFGKSPVIGEVLIFIAKALGIFLRKLRILECFSFTNKGKLSVASDGMTDAPGCYYLAELGIVTSARILTKGFARKTPIMIVKSKKVARNIIDYKLIGYRVLFE